MSVLCTVTFYPNLAHSLTRSPLTYLFGARSPSLPLTRLRPFVRFSVLSARAAADQSVRVQSVALARPLRISARPLDAQCADPDYSVGVRIQLAARRRRTATDHAQY